MLSRARELAGTLRDPIAREAVRQLSRPAPHLTDPEASALLAELEGLAGEAERLRGALKAIAEGGLGDEPWLAGYDRIREFARAALEAAE